VGLAVRSVEEVAGFWRELLGGELVEGYALETPEFLSRMLRVGEGLLELLEPRGEGGLIERFLDSRGEGIHHISIQVEDKEEVLQRCRSLGMTVIGGRFIHPKSAHGVLIEILGKDEGRSKR
jgi:methylmalonyl-CoA epimerase